MKSRYKFPIAAICSLVFLLVIVYMALEVPLWKEKPLWIKIFIALPLLLVFKRAWRGLREPGQNIFRHFTQIAFIFILSLFVVLVKPGWSNMDELGHKLFLSLLIVSFCFALFALWKANKSADQNEPPPRSD